MSSSHVDAFHDRQLALAFEERDTFYARRAEPGDGPCCFCLAPLVVGEWVDRLFQCHLECYDENISVGPKYNGGSDE